MLTIFTFNVLKSFFYRLFGTRGIDDEFSSLKFVSIPHEWKKLFFFFLYFRSKNFNDIFVHDDTEDSDLTLPFEYSK